MKSKTEQQTQFLELVEEHRNIVFKVANTYCHGLQDREDLTQETLGQLWRSWQSYDSSRLFSTWMYRVALNVAISFLRRKRRRRAISLDERIHDIADQSQSDLEYEERVREMYSFIDGLDGLSRGLLLLYLEDHSYSEIAEILGITETNVATKISRLKRRMSIELNPADDSKSD